MTREFSKDVYQGVSHLDFTVKYFWMKISPDLFPN